MAATTTKAHPAERARHIAVATCASAFVAIAGWFGLSSSVTPSASSVTTTQDQTQTQASDQNNQFLQGGQPGVVSNNGANTRSAGS